MDHHRLTGWTLAAIGGMLAAIQLAHALQQTTIPIAVAVDAVPFVAMALALAFVGYWVARHAEYEPLGPRVALWSVGGMVALASVGALVLFSQRVTTGTLDRAAYLTIDLITVGALGGALVGLYDAESRRRLAQLETERDRIQSFAGKAADVNNYGRAIYAARSVDGVAAYVVEAAETLVGLRETAVLRVEGDQVDPVANTVRSVDEGDLARLVDLAREYDARDVVVHGRTVDVDLPPEVDSVVTAMVSEDDGVETVIVALDTDEGEIAEEDRQLLELVVSHAAATIGRLAPEATV